MRTGDVIKQLREAFGKLFLDPSDTSSRRIHECFVVTPHEISKEGTNVLEGLVANEPFARSVTYVDGTRLWSLIETHLAAKILLPKLFDVYRQLRTVTRVEGLEFSGETLKLNFGAEHPAHAVPLNPAFSDTPEGQASKRAYENFIRTGEAAELPLSSVQGLSTPVAFETLGVDST